MFTKALLAVLAATTTTAAPAPLAQRADLQPWQITALSTHLPSGRPGSDPHSWLNVTIHDPNTIDAARTPTGQAVFPPSTANCSVQWLKADRPPYDMPQDCSAIEYGSWSVTILQGSGEGSAEGDFGLDFTLVDKVTVPGRTVVKTFKGGDQFKVGTNLGGSCGGSGVCGWFLENPPYEIQQTEQVV